MSFQQIDKLVTIVLGAMLLSGGILISLATSSPDSVPYREARTVIPVAIGLIALGIVGGVAYFLSRRTQVPRQAAPRQAGHSVVMTAAAADKIRRVFEKNPAKLKRVCVCIVQKPGGQLGIQLSNDPALRSSPSFASATCNGIVLVIPRTHVRKYADLVLDFQEGLFRFSGSAAPRVPTASHPGGLELSEEKLRTLAPEIFDDADGVKRLGRHLREGDARAAVVVTTAPLIVAAYTDELDAVALLAFPDDLARQYSLRPGSRLLTINSYQIGEDIESDLVLGAGNSGNYRNFMPVIGDFVSANVPRLTKRKSEIAEGEWQRTIDLANEAMNRARGRYRDGRPPNCGKPAY